LIEKEFLPRYKTCGGGLVYRGRTGLSFDVSSVIDREFYSIDIFFKGTNAPINTQKSKPIISMIMRDSFDHLIVQEAQKYGVTLLQGQKAESISMGEYAVINTSQQALEARFVIAADGALSPVAKMAGWPETRLMCPALEYEIKVSDADFARLSTAVRFDIDATPYGYAWCFPKKDHLSVGVGCFMKNDFKISLKASYQDYLKTLGIHEVLEEQAHGFIIPINARKDGFVKGNVFLIGDAAGFADPVTAEGISNAIFSGCLVAEAIIESDMNLNRAAQLYQSKLAESLLPQLQTAGKLAKIFYKYKTFRDIFLKLFGNKISDIMADVFMGERSYPKDLKASIFRNLKKIIFN
jgi:geranylgeranyl reductase family protein